ncbi:MAG: M23 family metallopeptidase [Gaiellaceae bacterium]
MRRHRTTARGIVFSLLLSGLAAAASASPSSGGSQAVPRLVFPLVAETALWDNYGDSRGTHPHAGIDMENPWRAPVVAVEEGKVSYATSGLGGCMLYLHGRSGTMYMYIHLNNDLTAKNDNRGGCKQNVTYAVPNGARVAAGEQIAWNGDSGDASGNPHLHFEVHPGGGTDANPFPHLKRAVRPLFAARPGSAFVLGLRGTLVGAGAGTVELQVDRVRHYPGGSWLTVPARSVELAVPPDAVIPVALLGDVAGVTRRGFKTSVPVTAFTLRAKTTTEAILGTAGVLRLGRLAPTG